MASSDSTVIAYYHENIAAFLAEYYLANTDLSYSYTVTSIYIKTDYRGEIKRADTAIYTIRHNPVTGDTSVVVDSAGLDENVPPTSLQPYFPEPEWYHFYFYPNDTGAGSLALGFDPDSSDSGAHPAGHITFDRNTYAPQTLSLHYRNYIDYRQYSLDYTFMPVDSVLVPTELKINGTRGTLLGRQYSRQILSFTDYVFDR